MIKNNVINRSAFGFPTTTSEYRKTLGIRPHESPRSYGSPHHLQVVNTMELGISLLPSKYPNDHKYELLTKIEQAGDHMFKFAQLTGIHNEPTRALPIEDVPATEIPAEERFLGAAHYRNLIE